MNLSKWISYHLGMCEKGKYNFTKACRYIAAHKNVKLVAANKMIASFEIKYGRFLGSFNLKNTPEYPEQYIKSEQILKKVSEVSQIPIESLKSKTRIRKVVEARQAYMIIAKLLKTGSLADIGDMVNRDHCTVLHAYKNEHIPNIQKIIAETNLL